ncbi:MAG: hypothetical protein V4787_16555 [Pseudomonadota bacterium]
MPPGKQGAPAEDFKVRLAGLSPALSQLVLRCSVLEGDELSILCPPAVAVKLVEALMSPAERDSFGAFHRLVPEDAQQLFRGHLHARAHEWSVLTGVRDWPADGQAPPHWKEGRTDQAAFASWAGELLDSGAGFVAAEQHTHPGATIFLATNASRVAKEHVVFTELFPLELQSRVDGYLRQGDLDSDLDAYMELAGGGRRPLLESARENGLKLIGIDSFLVSTTGLDGATMADRSGGMNAVALKVYEEIPSTIGSLGKVFHCGVSHASLDRDAHPHDVVGLGAYLGMPSIYFQPLTRMPPDRMARAEGVRKHQGEARDVATRFENTRAGYGNPPNTEYVFTRRQLPCDMDPDDALIPGAPGEIDDRPVEAAYDFRIWSRNSLWQIAEPHESDPEDEIPPPPVDDEDDSTASSVSDDER